MKDLEQHIPMLCPLCGNDQFESLDVDGDDTLNAPDSIRFRCSDCHSLYTKGELLAENAEAIEIATDEVIDDVVKDFEEQLKKAMKKWKF